MRRLLLVTYYFPPSGGSGVQRPLKLAKYLPDYGWQPTVLTVRPDAAAYPDLDPSLAEDVPPSARVERTNAWDPYALYARLQGKRKSEAVSVGFVGEGAPSRMQRLARWVRANVFLPDARVGWVPFAVARGRRLLAGGGFDAMLTTGPPHSAHLTGLLLSRLRGVPWVADFRDPWTDIDYAGELPATWPARRLDAALERAVLRGASAVTVVTPSWRERLARRVPGRYALIRNGFDPADFAGEAPAPAGDFVIAYLGNLNAARSPDALWEALRRLDDAAAQRPRLRVRFIGNVDPAARAAARRYGVGDRVEVRPYVPHGEAVRAMRRSTLLLLVINRAANQQGIIPGKLYEYIASGRPVLGVGPPEGDAAAVLRSAGAGRMFAHNDAEGVRRFVEAHYRRWAQGRPMQGACEAAAAPFSRRQQAGQLAALLSDVCRSAA